MGGVKTINMRAHGTQKTKTKAMCKTGHEHAANENTHKSCSHKP